MTETRIIEVAIEIINQEGFANLSLKKVSKKLKIKSPSLYNHISNLEDLKNKTKELIKIIKASEANK